MGVARHCYTAPLRAFADGDRTYTIRWYFVPDDRPFYEGMHAFQPMVDEMFTPSGGECEKTGVKPNPRKHYSGRDINERPGTHVHGDAEDFLGLSLTNKYRHFGHGLLDPCAEPQKLPGLAKFGIRVNEMHPSPLLKRGLKFGLIGDDMHAATSILASRLALGVVIDERRPSPLLPPVGLALGVVGVAIPVPVEVGALRVALGVVGLDAKPLVIGMPGLALGVVGVAIPVPVEVGEMRFALGVVGFEVKPLFESLYAGLLLGRTETPYPPESRNAGMLLGLIGVDVEDEIETLGAMLMLRVAGEDSPIEEGALGVSLGVVGVDVDTDADAEESSIGLALGLTVVDSAPPPPPPGSTCDLALPAPIDTDLTGDIVSGTSVWYTFAVAAFVPRTSRLRKSTGGHISGSVLLGTTCAGATPVGSISTSGPVDYMVFSFSSNTAYVRIDGPTSGTTHYTLRVES